VTLGLCFFLPFLNVVSIDGDFSQGDFSAIPLKVDIHNWDSSSSSSSSSSQ
jgi:hypothetical protein